jgi:hypothetical protein
MPLFGAEILVCTVVLELYYYLVVPHREDLSLSRPSLPVAADMLLMVLQLHISMHLRLCLLKAGNANIWHTGPPES